MNFITRPDTTDQKVIDEVVTRNVYEHKKFGFKIDECPVWVDLGANIGTFTCLASSKGCRVIAFEPEPDNFRLLGENVRTNSCSQATLFQEGVVAGPDGSVDLYLCKGEYNKYRHTIFKRRGRHSISIKTRNFQKVLEEYKPNGVKIDIEGAEIELLESTLVWPDHVTHIVFEYSFDVDPSIARFKAIVDSLATQFRVFHRKVDWTLEKWMWFPQAILVYCKR
jgi:FkbM family methyltransferase